MCNIQKLKDCNNAALTTKSISIFIIRTSLKLNDIFLEQIQKFKKKNNKFLKFLKKVNNIIILESKLLKYKMTPTYSQVKYTKFRNLNRNFANLNNINNYVN